MRKRLLPKWVNSFKDRHGKERIRFRRKGFKPYYFRSAFGTVDFMAEYRACLDGEASPVIRAAQERTRPGTVADLVVRYYRSSSFNSGGEMTRRKNKGIIDRFRDETKDDYVADFAFEHIDSILAKKAKEFPTAAKNLRKQLKRLFAYAVKIKMIQTNPVEQAESIKVKTKGYHTWTEAEIDRFEATHALGTKARLALEIMLWTGMRREDATKFGPDHIIGETIYYTQGKGQKDMILPVASQLQEAIDAMPASDAKTFLVNDYGKQFAAAGFGNRFRKWCDTAGLPQCSAHGLRKAISRRMAEIGKGNPAIKSVTGHSGDAEVALYTREADQARMAADTIRELSASEKANRKIKLAKGIAKTAETCDTDQARGGPGGSVDSPPIQTHRAPNLTGDGDDGQRRTEPKG